MPRRAARAASRACSPAAAPSPRSSSSAGAAFEVVPARHQRRRRRRGAVQRDVRAAFARDDRRRRGAGAARWPATRGCRARWRPTRRRDAADRTLFDAAPGAREPRPRRRSTSWRSRSTTTAAPAARVGRARVGSAGRAREGPARRSSVTPSPLGLRLVLPAADRRGLVRPRPRSAPVRGRARRSRRPRPPSMLLDDARVRHADGARPPCRCACHARAAAPRPPGAHVRSSSRPPTARRCSTRRSRRRRSRPSARRLRRTVVATAIARPRAHGAAARRAAARRAIRGARAATRDGSSRLTILAVILGGGALLVAGLRDLSVVERRRRTAGRSACCSPGRLAAALTAHARLWPRCGCGLALASRRRAARSDHRLLFVAMQLGVRRASSPRCWCSLRARAGTAASIPPPSICGTSRCIRGRRRASRRWPGILLRHARGAAGPCALALRDGAGSLAAAPPLLVAARRGRGAVARADRRGRRAIGAAADWPVPVSAVILGATACAAARPRRAAPGHVVPPRATSPRGSSRSTWRSSCRRCSSTRRCTSSPSASLRNLIETRYAREAMQHPQELQDRLQRGACTGSTRCPAWPISCAAAVAGAARRAAHRAGVPHLEPDRPRARAPDAAISRSTTTKGTLGQLASR